MEELEPGSLVMAVDQNRTSKWEPVYQGPYTVVERTKGGAYQLKNELDQLMEPKRTIDMLKPVGAKASLELGSKLGKGDNFVVETIIAHKKTERGYNYLVKWKGYSNKDNSWVHARDFNSEVLIRDYWRKKKANKEAEASSLTKGLGGSHVKSSASNKHFGARLRPRAKPKHGK